MGTREAGWRPGAAGGAYAAVIPVAGRATRLWPATAVFPKAMLPLVDRPIVAYAVDEAARAGLRDVIFITDPARDQVEAYFEMLPAVEAAARARGMHLRLCPAVRFHYVPQEQPLGLGHAVGLAEDLVGDRPFVVLLPDDVLLGPPEGLDEMVRLARRTGRPVVAVRPVDPRQVRSYGVVAPGARWGPGVHEVRDLVEKPSPEGAPSNLAIVGRYVLPPSIFPLLRNTVPSPSGDIELTEALHRLNREQPLLAYEFPGRVLDTGQKLGFMQATVEMALAHPEVGRAFAAYLAERCSDGQVEGSDPPGRMAGPA